MDGMENPANNQRDKSGGGFAQKRSTNHSSLAREKCKHFSLDSFVVEVPGIEPGSSSTKTGLLRA